MEHSNRMQGIRRCLEYNLYENALTSLDKLTKLDSMPCTIG